MEDKNKKLHQLSRPERINTNLHLIASCHWLPVARKTSHLVSTQQRWPRPVRWPQPVRWPRPVIRTELWITETEDFFQIDTLYSDDTFLICTRFLFQVSAHPLCQCCFFLKKKVVIISSIYHGCEVFASGWMEDLCYIVVSKWDYSAETRWCIFAVHDKDGHLWCLCCRLIPSLLYIPAEITHTAEVMFSSFLTVFFLKKEASWSERNITQGC